ncbi:hypothetical protein SAMN04489716_9376 [Actinoplanes derwentensis]|uniref:Uncharacterized protein n=1 Tax=Actinoplanes derwentensis TaxID=113562 RepID=A0A1H2DF21_9ACTN|nr:hypothetical protein Ade03nite_93590 [Actinoplanes derwentensis]SDT80826.1 hypothetical protein SAMN04489716_9376 [Actinoplanes derwentensis]
MIREVVSAVATEVGWVSGGDPVGAGEVAFRLRQGSPGFVQVAEDSVEADAGEADHDFLGTVGVGDHEQSVAGLGDGAGGFGEPAVGRDVQRPLEVPGEGEVAGAAGCPAVTTVRNCSTLIGAQA